MPLLNSQRGLPSVLPSFSVGEKVLPASGLPPRCAGSTMPGGDDINLPASPVQVSWVNYLDFITTGSQPQTPFLPLPLAPLQVS